MDDFPGWVSMIERIGIPAVVALVLLRGSWKAIAWIGTELVVPLRNQFTQFLQTLGRSSETQATAIKSLAETQTVQTPLLQDISRRLDEHRPHSQEFIP